MKYASKTSLVSVITRSLCTKLRKSYKRASKTFVNLDFDTEHWILSNTPSPFLSERVNAKFCGRIPKRTSLLLYSTTTQSLPSP